MSNLQASQSASAEHIERVIFQSMDVCSYADNVSLFKRALERFGRVDHAISVAGITEQGNIFSPELNLETVEEPPSMLTFDTNLRAVLYFARIASVYLRQSRTDGEDKSLTLFSSIAGITESPGLFEYGAAKHGVIGLMRALRPYAPEKLGIRVNALCPWMTATQMVAGIEESWYKAKLPVNQPDDVAKVIVDIVQSKSRNGGAFYVEGGRAWEVDRAMFSIAQDTWMGRERRIEWERGQEVLGIVSYIFHSLSAKSVLCLSANSSMKGRRLDKEAEVEFAQVSER